MEVNSQDKIASIDDRDSMLFFEKNTPLVYFMYNKHFQRRYSQYEEDLIQCGMLGLWRACKSFDKNKGISFCTFSARCIKNEMCYFLRKEVKYAMNTTGYNIIGDSGEEVDILEIVASEDVSVDEKLNKKLWLEDSPILKEYAEGKRIKDIADNLGKTRSQLEQIMKQERKILQDKYAEM